MARWRQTLLRSPPSAMFQKTARLQYLLLALVFGSMLAFYVHGATAVLDKALHGDRIVRPPFDLEDNLTKLNSLTPEAQAADLDVHDSVRSLDGHPFTGFSVLVKLLRRAHPGDPMTLVLARPDGSVRTTVIRLARRQDQPSSRLYFFTVDLLLHVVFPLFCILLGSWVVLAKPQDRNAWLLLGVFCYFPTNLLSGLYWANPFSLYFVHAIGTAANVLGPLWVFLFGIYFPQRTVLDVRFPWVKWIPIVLMSCIFVIAVFFSYGYIFNFSEIRWLAPHFKLVSQTENVISLLCFTTFFALLGYKHGVSSDPDSRRRLQVLHWGGTIACIPITLTVLTQLVRGTDFDKTIPQWALLIVFAFFTIFPLTLAYVVVVQRAMDVRILIRQGTRYAFARQSILIVRVLIGVWLGWAMFLLSSHPGQRRSQDLIQIFSACALFLIFRFVVSARLQTAIDQRFFREAYSTEQVLSELSEQVRTFTEAGPLLETVTERIGQTLHVERIAIFLRVGDDFKLHAGPSEAVPLHGAKTLILSATSTTMATVSRNKIPTNVFQSDPSSWLVDATDAERSALADLSTELLVPLPGRNRLAGVLALGPKRSEEPYTRTDRQLLQTVASQTGLALENAELLQNLSAEIAQRERILRDIEIAREVQERLFPQHYPKIAGVDLAGFCRPAQAVGGDYYDFFSLGSAATGGERLAIAIGDISGKGIPAALLMASLRASLRSIASLQLGSLALLIQHVNRLVFEASTSNKYATFFYAEYDPATRILAYVNAGHNAPYVLRGTEAIPLEATGTVVGLLQDAEYEQATMQLQIGDILLAFTDGISEAMTREDEEWGEQRMIRCAQERTGRKGCSTSAQQLLNCLIEAADDFTDGAKQHDDMTLLLCSIIPT